MMPDFYQGTGCFKQKLNSSTNFIFSANPCNQSRDLEVYSAEGEASDIMWMLQGFEFKSSIMRIKILYLWQ